MAGRTSGQNCSHTPVKVRSIFIGTLKHLNKEVNDIKFRHFYLLFLLQCYQLSRSHYFSMARVKEQFSWLSVLETRLPWRAVLFFIGLATLLAVSGGERSVYDWMPYDKFDEIDDRYRAVTAQNCKSKPASELRLPYGSVGQLPQFNRLLSYIIYPNRTKLLHVHNMALNRAFFFRYEEQWPI